MKILRAQVAVLAAAALSLSGCAVLLLGAGAAGGYAASKDSVKNAFDLPMEQVYRESLSVAKEMGYVVTQDPIRGIIKANIRDTHVTITIKQLTRQTVELKVKARNVMPKITVAQEVYNKIVEQLR